jgi:hypothetical protein
MERKAFRGFVTETIMAQGNDHPLRNLLDEEGRPYSARNMYSFDHPVFDAGHLTSHHGGGAAMGVEWSADNRLDGVHTERQGIILQKVFVEVGEVPIELGMLQTMENHGLVPEGTVAAAKPTTGWVRPSS